MTMKSMASSLSVAGAADLRVQLELRRDRHPCRAPLLDARFDSLPVTLRKVRNVLRLAGVDVEVEIAVHAEVLEMERAEAVLALARRVPVDVRDERVPQPPLGRHGAAGQQQHRHQRAAADQRSTIATARVQPAEAPRIFTGKQAMVKPSPGSASRLCSFSRWQY